MQLQRSLRILLLSIGIVFALFALSYVPPAQARSADAMAYIRVIHASPDVGTVDVFVDGNKILGSFQYSSVTDYVPLSAGAHNVQIALIGKGADAAVITQQLAVNANTAYTIAAIGTKATKLSLLVFTDDNIVVGNTSKVRIYHLSPGTGSASVTTDAQTLTGDLAYEQASNYVTLSAGTYTFSITIDPTHVTQTTPTVLKPWTVTSIFVVGLLNDDPKLHAISSQQQGLPGMPQTGADPTPLPQSRVQPQTPLWPLTLPVFLLIGLGFALYRRTQLRARTPVTDR